MSDNPLPGPAPVPGNTAITNNRGLLDIKVMLSTPVPTAGSEFTIYVQVTNPFDRPIWLEAPKVFLPMGLKSVPREQTPLEQVRPLNELIVELAESGTPPPTLKTSERRWWPFGKAHSQTKNSQAALKYMAAKIVDLDKVLSDIDTQRQQIQSQSDQITQGKSFKEKMELLNSDEMKLLSHQDLDLASKADGFRQRLTILRNELQILTGSSWIYSDRDLTLNSFVVPASGVYVEARGNLRADIVEPKRMTVLDDSSLRIGLDALQPGNTAVFSLVLTKETDLLFRPVQYEMVYSINYTFEKTQIYTNSVTQPLTIRAPIGYVFYGASLGGFIGFIARFLQTIPADHSKMAVIMSDWPSFLITLALTVILSAMAVVFLARKSETQSMVSVEDFWGGLVIGFLIGYTGTTAFESLTGVSTTGISGLVTPTPTVIP